MDRGSVIPADPVDGVKGQQIYNQVATAAGWSKAADTLDCLEVCITSSISMQLIKSPVISAILQLLYHYFLDPTVSS